MESYTPLIAAFVSGGGLLALINFVLSRRERKLKGDALSDDQTARWRDNALQLSKTLIEKDAELLTANHKLSDCEHARSKCKGCKVV